MSSLLNKLAHHLDGHSFSTLGESQTAFHCHHMNLFLDQTVDDALGPERGPQLRMRAAHEAAHRLLRGAIHQLQPGSPGEILALASDLFASLGHGRLRFETQPDGRGFMYGEGLHYGSGWKLKYGQSIRRQRSADIFAAGFGAAATELAHDLSPGTLTCEETRCVALNDPHCHFTLLPNGVPFTPRGLHPRDIPEPPPGWAGMEDETIETIAHGLRGYLRELEGDARGVIDAFGVLVTQHLCDYYNHITYRTLDRVRVEKPGVLRAFETLLRESGHVCVFYTFGGILTSPEWEGLFGPPAQNPLELVLSCLGIGRALGVGKLTLEEFDSGRYAIIAAPTTYESAYHPIVRGPSTESSCYFLQGAGPAIMHLAHSIDWSDPDSINPQTYNSLFQHGIPWFAEEVSCVSRGDACCRIVVSRRD